MRLEHKLILIAVFVCFSNSSSAEDWSCWRGPRGDGTSLEEAMPTEWNGPDSHNIRWKVPVPGRGHASPIVWDDKIFVAACDEETGDRLLVCFERESGRIVWKKSVIKARLERKHKLNSFASGTPATDGKLVYVTFLQPDNDDGPDVGRKSRSRSPGEMVVAAYDFDGNRHWLARPGRFASIHGYCSSPVLFEDKVIVNGDHDGDAYIVALSRETGDEVWRIKRQNKVRSYSTPIIRKIDGRPQMILSGSKSVASYDPRDGSRHWVIDGPTEQFVASIVYNPQQKILFMTAGFPERHILAIRPTGSGNVSDSHILWRTTKGCSYVPSPIAVGNYFLVVSDTGIASCFDVTSGERYWMERLGPHYSASLVTAGGLVYFVADDGTTTVVRPDKTLEVVSKNELGEYCYASPALSEGQIFIRGEESLWCIGPPRRK